MYVSESSPNRMKRPPNRMENVENREPEEHEQPPREREKLTAGPRGIACPWCKRVAPHRVRVTYPGGRRKRFCEKCRREFLTREDAL